jgi:hypothetical protein
MADTPRVHPPFGPLNLALSQGRPAEGAPQGLRLARGPSCCAPG